MPMVSGGMIMIQSRDSCGGGGECCSQVGVGGGVKMNFAIERLRVQSTLSSGSLVF